MTWSVVLFGLGLLSLALALGIQVAGRTSEERAHSGNIAAIGTACLVFAVVIGVM